MIEVDGKYKLKKIKNFPGTDDNCDYKVLKLTDDFAICQQYDEDGNKGEVFAFLPEFLIDPEKLDDIYSSVELVKVEDKKANESYDLVGVDGNAFSVMSYVSSAMKECGFSKDEIGEYRNRAMDSDYDNLLIVSMEYIDKCNSKLNNSKTNNSQLGPQTDSFTAEFGPGKYFLGDICYALPEEKYKGIQGDKYNYEDGFYGDFAVGGTAYGDGEYYGGGTSFSVDAGVIGVVNITDDQRYTDEELNRLGKVVDVKDKLVFNYDGEGIFDFYIDGKLSITVNTKDEYDEDEYEESDWDDDSNWENEEESDW